MTDPPATFAFPADDAAPSNERAVYWDISKRETRRLRRATRRVRITFGVDVCDKDIKASELVKRIDVVRRKRSVVITVIEVAEPTPYGKLCYGFTKDVKRRVGLHGRLGPRSLRDGSFRPARLKVNAPRK